MLINTVCPKCGALNTGLDLQETLGLYVCNQCMELINTNREQASAELNQEAINFGISGAKIKETKKII